MSDNKLAVVFPGQGSQSVGMIADFANQFPEVTEYFLKASDILQIDLWEMIQHGPAETLNQTQYTQPALLVASYAMWRATHKEGSAKPEMMAGHSLGEYSALLCANALTFDDAVRLVFARGQYMQQAVENTQGAMAAIIGLSNDAVSELCQQAIEQGEVLSPANFNSIGQVVIAGHKTAVERAVARAKEQGAKMAVLIPVSVPSHCELMKTAAVKLQVLLSDVDIKQPETPVISNVDVLPYQNATDIRNGLVRQLYMPVRWVETIEYFMQHGIERIIECGPGKVLTGLNKRINKNLELKTLEQIVNAS